jgi:hypothetical protein
MLDSFARNSGGARLRYRPTFLMVITLVAGCGKTSDTGPADAPAESASGASAAVVRLVKEGEAWKLQRNGLPYFIRGAGGDGSRELLASLGGNSIRTWSADDLDRTLADAERLGLTVCVGIWLGHQRHGFNWNDPAQVALQKQTVKETILKYKHHPAILLWALGNEMEGYEAGDDEAIWNAINDLAVMAKSLDSRPTMTVIAEVGGKRVPFIHRLCPAIDVVGINSYGGAPTLPARYREAGGTKPYILTEFGPRGSWESGKNEWGAVLEPTSTEKAADYEQAYEFAVKDQPACLGSYAFIWGHKQEATATWFGMLLPDGGRLAAADAVSQMWTGKPPPNACPTLANLAVDGSDKNDPGATVRAAVEVADPDGDPVKVRWVLQADPMAQGVGGDAEQLPPTFPDAVVAAGEKDATLKMPAGGGAYRLFAYASDGRGGAAVTNVPLFVNGKAAPQYGSKAVLPLMLYDEADRANPPYAPSGWMGSTNSLKLDDRCTENPHSGKTCLRIDFSAVEGWGAVAWQNPANDWGDQPGGWDLTGAKRLSFWLRGETGNESCNIELGIIDKEKKFPDTHKAKLAGVKLTREWQEHSIDVSGKDLRRIKTGFVVSITSSGKPTTIFIDDCRYE